MSKKDTLKNKSWVNKYRPTSMDDIIFQNDQHKEFFIDAIKKQHIPSVLFSGVQGTGKTTMSHVLINELNVDPLDVLKIKCSDITGIDAMREEVSRFAETMSMGKFKIIQMEEADYLSHNAQAILRHIVEDNDDNCKFIFTCNYANKLMPALRSRLQRFEFKAPAQEDILIKMAEILAEEQIDADIEVLEKIVAACYPDIRQTIHTLYKCSISGKLISPDVSTIDSDWKFTLLDYIEKGEFTAARKLVCENVSREEYEDLYYWLYKNIHRAPKFKDPEKQKSAIVVISDYEYKSSFMAHQDICAEAMFISLDML